MPTLRWFWVAPEFCMSRPRKTIRARPKMIDEVLHSFRQGQERARMLGGPVLVSVSRPMPQSGLSPLAAFSAGKGRDKYRTFWAQPYDDFWMVGLGAASAIAAGEGRRFHEIREAHNALLRNAVVNWPGVRGVGPIIIGGFRFDVRSTRSDLWDGFPEALLLLPKFLFTWSGDQAWLTINSLVCSEDDIHADAGALAAQLEAIGSSQADDTCQQRLLRETESPKEEWRVMVRDALRQIDDGALSKVVLARNKVLHAVGPFSLECIVGQLATSFPECSVFAIDNGESSFVGATPESLVHMESGMMHLTCMAGTTARGSSPEDDARLARGLLGSSKERLEHTIVVNEVVRILGGICSNLQWDAEPQVVQLRNVQHLRTLFTGHVNDGNDIIRLVELLHPTPAVGGAPTDRALEAIRNLEGDRGWYAAPIGWMDQRGEGEFGVAIRSALVRGNRATLFAGAGIVKGSDPDRELEETELKFPPLACALGWCVAK